jgi:hypothetical protein
MVLPTAGGPTVSVIRMDLDAAGQLLAAGTIAANGCDRHRIGFGIEMGEAQALLGRVVAPRAGLVLRQTAIGLRRDADELRWRRNHLLSHGIAMPGASFVIGTVPKRRPHPVGPFGDGPFSLALAGLGPSAKELAALDHLATIELHTFLKYRTAAQAAASPFDWSASGAFVWEACSGPVPDAAEDACLRHDFIYRNWRRLRDDFAIDPDAGDELKDFADARLGDEVHAAVMRDLNTWLGWQNVFTWGLPVIPILWAESVEPAVDHLGDDAWNGPYDREDIATDYYGGIEPPDVGPDPAATEELRTWLCPPELCSVDGWVRS